jgi:GAF domain-containing protein/nitrogen-specific signal transduction histidine kinase
MKTHSDAEFAELERTVAELRRELADSRSAHAERIVQQAATVDVLQAMSASPGDPQPVFDLIVRRAAEICDAPNAVLFRYDGELLHWQATAGAEAFASSEAYDALRRQFPMPPSSRSSIGRGILSRQIEQVRDVDADPDLYQALRDIGMKSLVGVPLLRDGEPLGVIGLSAREAGGFSDTQVALLRTFAEQAVIAITSAETWHALRERTDDLRQSLEYQTATSDILKLISRSTFDLQPVLESLAETAARLCDADQAAMALREGDLWRFVASHGFPLEYEAHNRAMGAVPLDLNSPTVSWRSIREAQVIHVHDAAAVPGYGDVPIRLGKQRTSLGVPLLRQGVVIGTFMLARQRVEPFTDQQIELVSTFADQAVIAMENTRLLTEQLEALDQQTATAEILRIINENPGDLTPVFDAVLENGLRLIDAAFGGLWLYDGDMMRSEATRGMTAALAEFRARNPVLPISRAAREASETQHSIQILDLKEGEAYRSGRPATRAVADLGGARTMLVVPLLKDNAGVGAIQVYRQEVRAFTAQQIALLESFATQAVIAIENARLLTEQREALDQQTATAELLQVINASPGNLEPVFDAMLEKALRLCDSAFGILGTYDGEVLRCPVARGVPDDPDKFLEQPQRPVPGTALYRVVQGENVVQITDITDDAAYHQGIPGRRFIADICGGRSQLVIALRKDRELLGMVNIFRQEVRPFTDKQITLLENFAAQAVIAMENARLLTEQRQALERQTATAEVLGVINENPGNLAPVFDTILEKALTLSEAAFGTLWTFDTENAAGRIAATRNIPPALAEFRAEHPPSGPSPLLARLLDQRRPIHQLDIRDDESYRSGHASPRSVVELGGARTLLLVPLLKDRNILGTFQIYRQEVRGFTDRQISLVENFAAQAVIAMDNARLLREQREALERQTAMAEVLQVINTNPGNLRPVFDGILAKAHAVCGADMGGLFLWNDTDYWLEASLNNSAAYEELFGRPRPRDAGFLIKRLTEEPYVHIPDCQAIMADINRAFGPEIAERAPRTSLSVALRKDGVTTGHITANRWQMRPYTSAEISLLESFAAQAVIAMDNARLLNEIRQRQSELDITFENMGDGVAMFDRERKLAAWNRNFQDILDLPDDAVRVGLPFDDYIRGLAAQGEYGPDANADEQIARLTALLDQANRFERTRPNGRVIDIRQNPIPDGGFVIIYADITERKRAEEALRTARDDAETALRDLKVAQASLVQAEKMASLGQLTAGIAHEIKNPLNFVNNFAALSVELLDELTEVTAPALATLDDDARADADDLTGTLTSNLHKIEEHGKRADNIVRGMLEHSRTSTGERRAVDLNELVEEALNLAYHGARARDQSFNITLERDYAAGIAPIEVAPQDLTRVFLNLFGNGFDAARTRQKTAPAAFEPKLRVSTRDRGDSVQIHVRDNGTGVPPEIRDKLFQPFFTTKPTGEGTGLGLSISYDIVTQQHGGSIALDSEPNVFTEFTVTIPRGMASGQGGTP